MKYILLIAVIAANLLANEPYIDLKAFVTEKNDIHNDISYMQMAPQYEENMPVNKAVVLEFYSGSFDKSQKSLASLDYINSIIKDEIRRDPKIKVNSVFYAMVEDSFKDNKALELLKSKLTLNGKTKNEVVPKTLLTLSKGRSPSSLNIKKWIKKFPERWGWTLFRGTSVSAGTFLSIVGFAEGIPTSVAMSASVLPGVISGGITFYNGAYGDYLTNSKWAKWLYTSEKAFPKKMRSLLGMGDANLFRRERIFTKFYKTQYQDLYKNNPEIFKKLVATKVKKSFLGKFTHFEEYLKWYITEIAFVGGAIKAPQAILGLGNFNGFLAESLGVLETSVIGMIAQGPGDIAIQKRKFQKIDELEQAIRNGTKKVENPKLALEDIKKFKNSRLNYRIGPHSHIALRKIENWARSRATLLSFISVAGVSLDMLNIPASKPILIGVGLGGGVYYAHVDGVDFSKIKGISKKVWKKVSPFLNPFNLPSNLNGIYKNIANRWCSSPFSMPLPR